MLVSLEESKAKQLAIIANKEGVTNSSVILIDDSLSYLREARSIGAKPVLVRWGFGRKRAIREAKHAGIQSMRLPWFFGRSKQLSKILRQMRS